MSIPVIDACVAIKWFLPETGYEMAGEIFKSHNKMMAPDLFFIEFDAVVTKKVRQKLVDREDANKMYQEIRNIPFEIIPYSLISNIAFDLSSALSISLYDACYLAVAIEFDEKIFTADKRFFNGMKNTPFGHHLEYV
ncbi:MAG: type II toxin-antitoxin system VapC family toxin [Balneolaceae bacterium]|nr:type II toxin-antitoxin system VapC family toxin [Balneolaceae bacterium]